MQTGTARTRELLKRIDESEVTDTEDIMILIMDIFK